MAIKPPSYCVRCRAVHAAQCPHKTSHNWADKQRGKSGRGGRPWQRQRERVFARDSYLCQICLRAGKYKAVELHGPAHGVLDHIVPMSQGGTDDTDNLQSICQPCNKVKMQAEAQVAREKQRG